MFLQKFQAPVDNIHPELEMLSVVSDIVCSICGRGDDEENLVICDLCEAAQHISCVNIVRVPDGPYFCPSCI